jgi:hypothetical protein
MKCVRRWTLLQLVLLFCFSIAGCGPSAPPPAGTGAKDAPAGSLTVVLLGDPVRQDVISAIAKKAGATAADVDGRITYNATAGGRTIHLVTLDRKADEDASIALIKEAGYVLLVADAGQGSLPAFRQHARLAAQHTKAPVALLMANVTELDPYPDNVERLDKREAEERETASGCGLAGDKLPCYHDGVAKNYPDRPGMARGLDAVLSAVGKATGH